MQNCIFPTRVQDILVEDVFFSPHLRLCPRVFHSGGTCPGSASSSDPRQQTYIIAALWALRKTHENMNREKNVTSAGKIKQNIPHTRHSRRSLDEFAVEMLNYGLTLLRGLHPEKQESSNQILESRKY